MKLLIKDLVLGSGAPDELQSPALSDIYDTLTSDIGFNLAEVGPVNSCGIGYTDAEGVDVELLLKDCVASWNCNEGSGVTLGDNSGNGYDGELMNGATWTDGISGKAVSFDGVNDYVNLGASGFPTFSGSEFSLSMWFKASDVLQGNNAQILQFDDGMTTRIYADCRPTENQYYLLIYYDYTTYTSIALTASIDTDKHHLVSSISGTKWDIYFDGSLLATKTLPVAYAGFTPTIFRLANNTSDFKGWIDEVRIGNRALTAAEVRFLYNNPGSMDTITVAAAPDTNGLYMLDGTFQNDALEFGRAIVSHDGSYIGRVALGFARSLGAAPSREAGFYSTQNNRITPSGQVVPGSGGYYGRRLAVDFRYKIDSAVFDDIEAAIAYISQGYPWFMELTAKEQARIPFTRLYASPESADILLQSSVNRFRYSKQFDFYERF